MSRLMSPVLRALRALRAAPACAMEAVTGLLPAFRLERWSGGRRWLLTSRPLAGYQPAYSDVQVYGLGRLTLLRVTC